MLIISANQVFLLLLSGQLAIISDCKYALPILTLFYYLGSFCISQLFTQ